MATNNRNSTTSVGPHSLVIAMLGVCSIGSSKHDSYTIPTAEPGVGVSEGTYRRLP